MLKSRRKPWIYMFFVGHDIGLFHDGQDEKYACLHTCYNKAEINWAV